MSASVRPVGLIALTFLALCSACADANDLAQAPLSAQPTDTNANVACRDSVSCSTAPKSRTADTTTTALVTPIPGSTVAVGHSTQSTAPPTSPSIAVPTCAITLTAIVPGSSTQATLYSVRLPPSLVGNTISLKVDAAYTVDVQDSVSPTEYLAWQPGDPQPSPSAAQIVAVAEPGDGTTSPVSCPIPPGVSESPLTPEQVNGFIDPGVLTAYQTSLDAKVNTAGVPKKGYGDTVRSLALPTPHHAVLIAYQRDRCTVANSCADDSRTRQSGTETTSLYCVDIKGTQSTLVAGVTPLKDQYMLWPSVAQVAADMSSTGWCQ